MTISERIEQVAQVIWTSVAILLIAFGGVRSASAQTAPAAPGAVPSSAAAAAPAPAGTNGIRSQNIFDVRSGDASEDPKYLEQNNAERGRVQPGNNAPMWRAVGAGTTGFTSLPRSEAPEAGNLIQPAVRYPGSRLTTAGEAWRQVRNNWIIPYGGSLFIITLVAFAIFYFTKGPIEQHSPDTGRKIQRFTPFERAAHWTNAVAFSVLAISGLVMAFGKFILLPVMGGALFGWLTYVLKTAHNFVGPLFAVSLVIIFFTFLRDNWPQKGDLRWMLKAGGLFGKPEDQPPSNRFNAGEKVVFWGGVFFLGLIVVASGFVLDKIVPGLLYERGTMQIAHMIHAVAAVFMMCLFAGHIYLGTLGQRGAYSAMRRGWVDDAWAHDHHAYWYEEVRAGRVPRQRKPEAAVTGIPGPDTGATDAQPRPA